MLSCLRTVCLFGNFFGGDGISGATADFILLRAGSLVVPPLQMLMLPPWLTNRGNVGPIRPLAARVFPLYHQAVARVRFGNGLHVIPASTNRIGTIIILIRVVITVCLVRHQRVRNLLFRKWNKRQGLGVRSLLLRWVNWRHIQRVQNLLLEWERGRRRHRQGLFFGRGSGGRIYGILYINRYGRSCPPT